MIQIALALTALSVNPQGDLGSFEVRSVEKTAVFAGKLGKRVTERLEASRDGKTYRVIIDGAYHTWVGGRRMPEFAAGDAIHIRGSLNGESIRTNWDGISKD